MSWRSFLEYVTMRELGQSDAVHRNYAIEFEPYKRGGDHITHAISAGQMMGVYEPGMPLNYLLTLVRSMLANCGYHKEDLAWLERTMCEWETWHRLRTGSLRRWTYRKPANNPLI